MAELGLPWELFNLHQLEWYGRVNLLKGGMAFADAVTTVSPSHAHELRTPAGGFGLHDAFIGLRERFVGIVNGIDQQEWDPATDPIITARYTKDDLSGKKRCKAALQRVFGLPQRSRVPIFGMSARMVYQKGLDLILGSPRFLSLDAQFLFLGQGEKKYVDILTELALRAPGRIGVQTNFTGTQEHRLHGRRRRDASCRRSTSRAASRRCARNGTARSRWRDASAAWRIPSKTASPVSCSTGSPRPSSLRRASGRSITTSILTRGVRCSARRCRAISAGIARSRSTATCIGASSHRQGSGASP